MPRFTPPSSPSSFDTLAIVHPNAAGLDIGSNEIVAALPPNRSPSPVRPFSTFTPDLNALVDWLVAANVDTVVMESTGVYWVPIYDLLEQRGLKPVLVNSRCSRVHSGPMPRSSRCARSCAIALN
jgi:transposase